MEGSKWAGIGILVGLGVAIGGIPTAMGAHTTFHIDDGEDSLTTTRAQIRIGTGDSTDPPETVLVEFVGCGASDDDTRVRRNNDVDGVPGAGGVAVGATGLTMTYLCLTAPVPAELDDLFVNADMYATLQSGVPSDGTMEVRFFPSGQGGTLNSTLNVNYDLRDGSEGGSVRLSGSAVITTTSEVTWTRTNPGAGGANAPFCHENPAGGHLHCVVYRGLVSGGSFVAGGKPQAEPGVPTLSAWGLLLVSGLVLVAGVAVVHRRRSG